MSTYYHNKQWYKEVIPQTLFVVLSKSRNANIILKDKIM